MRYLLRSPLALHAVLAASLLGTGCRTRDAWGGPGSEPQRVVILHFRVDSTGSQVAGAVLAESLAVRLAAVKGLTARAGGGGEADYEVRGEIATREGRLVIATRLHHPGQEQPIWSATFWRKDSLDSSLVSDLTISIAEAIYSALAREAAGERRKAP